MKSLRKMMLVAAVVFCCQPPETKTMDLSSPADDVSAVSLEVTAPSVDVAQPTNVAPVDIDMGVADAELSPAGFDMQGVELQGMSADTMMPMLQDEQIDDEELVPVSLEQDVIAPMPEVDVMPLEAPQMPAL